MHATRHEVAVTTDGTGASEDYTTDLCNGRILTIRYVKPGSGGITNATFTVTIEKTGEAIWSEASINASATRAPRQPICGGDGAGSVFIASGEPIEDYIVIADSRIKIVTAGGGATLSGTFHIIVG